MSSSSFENIQNNIFQNVESNVFLISKSQIGTIQNVTVMGANNGIIFDKSQADTINKSTFQKCTGAILSSNSNFTVTSSSFIDNHSEKGGAISIECTSIQNCNSVIFDSVFQNNIADTMGGAIYYNYKRPVLSQNESDMAAYDAYNTFVNNTAQYGPDIASYAIKLVMNESDSDQFKIDNVGSGVKLSYPIYFSLVDYDGQVMILNSQSQIRISSFLPNTFLLGIVSAKVNSGVSIFDDLTFLYSPGQLNIEYRIVSKALDYEKLDALGISASKSLYVSFRY